MKDILSTYGLGSIHEIITEITPRGYNLESKKIEIEELSKYPDKTSVCVSGFIDKFETKPMNATLVKISAKLYKDGKSISCSWVSHKKSVALFLYGLEKNLGEKKFVQVTGKINSFQARDGSGFRIVYIENPKISSLSYETSSQTTEGYILPEPLYRLKGDISVYNLRKAFSSIFKNLSKIREDEKEQFLPIELEKELGLEDLEKSLKTVHGLVPIKIESFEDFLNNPDYYRRISAERIWSILLSSFLDAKENINEKTIHLLDEDVESIKYLITKLSFELTDDQKKTIWGVLKVFSSSIGSRSLVFGDVGSGKTMVALFVSYILYLKGFQVAIMTPTSILSKQHYEEFLEILGKDVFLVHSKSKAKEKAIINNHLSSGKPAIVIGTTSINSLSFKNLGAVFIDEEQKLGVAAKEKLVKDFGFKPHLVFMSATPIPRTLAASIYTNFHVFQIKVKPKNRLPRKTSILDGIPSISEIEMIKNRLANNEQGLVIIPSIDSNELANVASTLKKYKSIFPDVEIKFINGRMDKKETEAIIEEYMKGNFSLLIATSMVDSGFSNKNLSFVFIENADRFGISQLHQIRGRCGRGTLQGHCYLVPSKFKGMKDTTKKRLSFMCNSEDGFELSEFDLNMRGSGDLKGEEQSGTDVNFIEWINEIDIMKKYIKNHIL